MTASLLLSREAVHFYKTYLHPASTDEQMRPFAGDRRWNTPHYVISDGGWRTGDCITFGKDSYPAAVLAFRSRLVAFAAPDGSAPAVLLPAEDFLFAGADCRLRARQQSHRGQVSHTHKGQHRRRNESWLREQLKSDIHCLFEALAPSPPRGE